MSKKRKPVPKKVTVTPTYKPPTSLTTEEVIIEPRKSKADWKQLVKQLPDAKMMPTQRWYGENFYNQYTTILTQLRALANE